MVYTCRKTSAAPANLLLSILEYISTPVEVVLVRKGKAVIWTKNQYYLDIADCRTILGELGS
jgi:hypothetical protein